MLRIFVITTTFLLLIFSFSLGILSVWRHHKSKVAITWFLTSMAITVWSFGYLLMMLANIDDLAFTFMRIVYLGACLIPIFSFHFFTTFLFLDHQYRFLIYLGYGLALIFLFLIEMTKYIISGVRYLDGFGRYEEIGTLGFYLFLIYFFFFVFFGVYLLIKNYLKATGFKKRQLFYIILASLFGFLGGISNFVTDLTGVYPYGQMVVWLYPVLVYYGVFMEKIRIKID